MKKIQRAASAPSVARGNDRKKAALSKTGLDTEHQPSEMRRILVTGGSQGIGRGIVERLAGDGYQPVNFDIVPPSTLAARESYVAVDLRDKRATIEALTRVLAEGPILNLVHNVAVNRIAAADAADPDDLDALVAVNLKSGIRCMQALLPGMKHAGYGRIVALSSRVALGRAGRSLYAATKAAIIALCRTWALELAPHGITVNVVAPGLIDTPLFRANNSPAQARTLMRTMPVGRLGEVADVAHAVAHFIDRRSGFVTGQTLYVCGGTTIGVAQM